MSGLNLRLNEIDHKIEKFSQISAYKFKAQWLSGLNLRLATCLRPTQLCGGGQTKRKSFDFLLLVHSQLCGGGQTKRKSFDFLLLVHSQLCGGRPTKRKSFDFLLLVHSQLCGDRPTKRKLFNFLLFAHSLLFYLKNKKTPVKL
ncbi:hypothetical protein [Globicatella sanguinis]